MRWLASQIRAVWRRLTTRRSTRPTAQPGGGVNGTETRNPQSEPPRDTLVVAPEQTVEHLLVEHGGRLKQGQISALTGWSPAKASRVLSEMEVEGRVIRKRVGREKVVCMPHAVPDSLGQTTA